MRGFKGGHRIFLREVARVLRQQRDELKRMVDAARAVLASGKPLALLVES